MCLYKKHDILYYFYFFNRILQHKNDFIFYKISAFWVSRTSVLLSNWTTDIMLIADGSSFAPRTTYVGVDYIIWQRSVTPDPDRKI